MLRRTRCRPDAGAGLAAVLAAPAIETLEDLFVQAAGDAGTVVRDRDPVPLVARLDGDLDLDRVAGCA